MHPRKDRSAWIGGHDAVAVTSAEEFDRFAPEKPKVPFVQFMESLHLGGLNVDRELDRRRGIEL